MKQRDPKSTDGVRFTDILLLACALVFIAWAVVGSIFMVKSANAIEGTANAASSTALMCAERMINEVELKKQQTTTIETLQRENLFLRGRLETFETLYGLSRESYEKSKGAGGP